VIPLEEAVALHVLLWSNALHKALWEVMSEFVNPYDGYGSGIAQEEPKRFFSVPFAMP